METYNSTVAENSICSPLLHEYILHKHFYHIGSERTFTMATTPPYDGPEEALIPAGSSAGNPFLHSPPSTQGVEGIPDNNTILSLGADDTPLHSGITAPLFSRQTSSATDDFLPNTTATTNTSNNNTRTTNISTSKQASDAASVLSAESNTSSQERALGAHRMLNRLEIIEQVLIFAGLFLLLNILLLFSFDSSLVSVSHR